MSDYGQERGKVKLPTKEWKTFKDSVYNSYNSKMDDIHNTAIRIYEILKLNKKGKRNFDLSRSFDQDTTLQELLGTTSYYGKYYFTDMVKTSLIKDNKLIKPKKKDFKHMKSSKCEELNDDDLSVKFDNKTKTVFYSSSDNNNSVDCARESFLGRTFFRALNRVTFTSKTGGYFKATSEYNTDEYGNEYQSRVSCSYGKYKTSKKYRKEIYGY